ncbi:hypothetical protein KP79_PYT25307 [Mizuhopecten yessoensis]|uniref:Endonuclease/exonuclease/phosphatase domain-containing protein n=1 Tax=Mizuhopecten yessoensis TaxID=6573 RepID=A0A210PKY1_MIZYE|nr:hypothetical protein KP79_PYT25307 [Mizuhopecten yessoensis]
MLVLLRILLLLSSDIESNPGPSVSDVSSVSSCSSNFTTLFDDAKYTFVHLNVQSIKHKFDILFSELYKINILSFTETWLSPNEIISDSEFPGFSSPYCYCRPHRQGGGVSVYVSNSITSKRRSDLELPSVECVWVQLNILGKLVLYGTFYRPPDEPVSSWDHIAHSIELAFNTGIPNIIITGDFNANLLNNNNNHSIHLRNLLTTYNLTQSVANPTFFTESSSSLLDIVCASDPSLVNLCHVGESFLDQPIRYHCPVYGSLNISKPIQSCFKRNILLYDLGDYDDYRDKLSKIDWDSILDNNNIDRYTDLLTDIILKTARECIPNKTK